jgi:hypothetical protein
MPRIRNTDTSSIFAHAHLGCGEPACRVGDEEAANDVPRVLADPPVLRDRELSRLDFVEQLLKQPVSYLNSMRLNFTADIQKEVGINRNAGMGTNPIPTEYL